jgi:hypothetical protein
MSDTLRYLGDYLRDIGEIGLRRDVKYLFCHGIVLYAQDARRGLLAATLRCKVRDSFEKIEPSHPVQGR